MITNQLSFECFADATRRTILELLRHGERPVGMIAADLPVSRPAVSQHLRLLERAGLVTHRSAGTRNYYRLDTRGFAELRAYLDSFWTDVLDAYAHSVPEKNDDH